MGKKITTGSVYQRVYRDRNGVERRTATWFLKYYVKGKPVIVPTSTEDYDEALTLLRHKMAKAATEAVHYSEEPERVLVGQLLDLLIENYRFAKRHSTYDAECRIDKHLRPFFGHKKATAVTTRLLKQYLAARIDEAQPATINKELAYLRRAFRLGFWHEPQLVEKVPRFEMLPLDNTRTGMLSHEQYRKIRDSLPPYARIALVIAYHTGARKGEIRKIRLDQINTKTRRIQLPGKTTKNGTPRYLPIYGDMKAELEMAQAVADSQCPFLLQQAGKPVFDWEKSWKTACKLAEVDQALFHDLRRTALTNMIEAGFSEKEAMEISGHKTRSVFDRYHIVSERRLNQLAERLEGHIRAKDLETTVSDGGIKQNAQLQ